MDKDLVNDLNTLLGEATPSDRQVLEELNPEPGLETSNILEDIDLLDDSKEDSKSDLSTPGELLQEYTDAEKESMKVKVELEEFKQKHLEVFEEYQVMLDKLTDISNTQSELKTKMTNSMEQANIKTISNDMFKITFVAATKKSTFDRKGFEAKYPVLCQQFLKYSDVSAYVKITEVK